MPGTTTQPLTAATADDPWPPGPPRPLLTEGALHVWRADLRAINAAMEELLCDEERARAERFRRERERQLWMRSRGVLRALLGRYLRADGRALRFATGAHGKPELREHSRISFNLSHSGHLALYAFSGSGAVGIDVEVGRRSIDELALAARAFDPADMERLQELHRSARKQEFLRLWTRHEAELKLRGSGIGARRTSIKREPWIAELEIGSQAAGAVAVGEQPRELRCWSCLEDLHADRLTDGLAADDSGERG